MESRFPFHQAKTFDTPIQVVLAGLFGLLLGTLVIFVKPIWLLIAIIGIFFIILTIRKPVWGILSVLLILTTVIPESQIPYVHIGPLRALVSDLVVAFLIALIILRLMLAPSISWQRTPP